MAITNEIHFNIVGEVPVAAIVNKGAQNDIVVLPHAGVRNVTAQVKTGAAETLAYPTLTIVGSGTATSKKITYSGAVADTRPGNGYYLMSKDGEILYVLEDTGSDGTGGVVTVKRGALGTTPTVAGVANGETLYILCSLKLAGDVTGPVFINYSPLPPDPNTQLYGKPHESDTSIYWNEK